MRKRFREFLDVCTLLTLKGQVGLQGRWGTEYNSGRGRVLIKRLTKGMAGTKANRGSFKKGERQKGAGRPKKAMEQSYLDVTVKTVPVEEWA